MMNKMKCKPGDLACSYIDHYIHKPYLQHENHIRWIPLYLKKMKISVCMSKDSSTYEVIITKYNVHTVIPEELSRHIVIINDDQNSIIYLKGSRNDILDIIYLLTQTFGLVVQPLSLNSNTITFSQYQKTKNLIINRYILSNNVPISTWLIILSNMNIEPISNELISIDEI